MRPWKEQLRRAWAAYWQRKIEAPRSPLISCCRRWFWGAVKVICWRGLAQQYMGGFSRLRRRGDSAISREKGKSLPEKENSREDSMKWNEMTWDMWWWWQCDGGKKVKATGTGQNWIRSTLFDVRTVSQEENISGIRDGWEMNPMECYSWAVFSRSLRNPFGYLAPSSSLLSSPACSFATSNLRRNVRLTRQC